MVIRATENNAIATMQKVGNIIFKNKYYFTKKIN